MLEVSSNDLSEGRLRWPPVTARSQSPRFSFLANRYESATIGEETL
jgi:hypothetical protein